MILSTTLLIIVHVFARAIYAYTPLGRAGSTGILIGNKIFVQGGVTSVSNTSNYGVATSEVIILPIDVSYPLSAPAYESDSGLMNGSPQLIGQVSAFGGYNNSGLYMFGGQLNSANGSAAESSSLYLFNTTSYKWTTVPTTAGSWPPARDSASSVSVVSTGTSFMFGGEPKTTGSTWLFNSTWSLQYGNTWSEIGGVAPGGGRQSHGAVMLSDGRMVILGGTDHLGNAIPLSSILIFHTNSQQYTVRVRKAVVVAVRNSTDILTPTTTECDLVRCQSCPTTVICSRFQLTHDDKIIIHGGDGGNGKYLADLAVLDMTKANLSWAVPTTSGNAPTGRLSHIGVMVGTQMFIMYGQLSANSVGNGVYVIDTNSWTWQTTYTPQNLQYTNTGDLSPSGSNITSNGTTGPSSNPNGDGENGSSNTAPKGAVIGGSVGGAVAVLALGALAAGVWIRRRRRNADAKTSNVYQLPETEPHNTPLANNMYDSAPPYYPQYSVATAHTSARDSSTAVNSMGDPASYGLTEVSQKPNVPNETVYQKPNAD
ncbi:hypothetical protein INT43_008448 [Umbelopsis isabellina]|uniref:Galactose oxidase n=1 Tax=Mortierella isabellina TaxID=91625 RepID=A0A8H7PUM1_MORIS|nr:hypothetical protein INT43_008448 [Umbelopsis isabellina]